MADPGRPPRARRTADEGAGSFPWLLTYSDMVTLLLTFFILLFAMSEIDAERFRRTILSIQSSLSGHTGIMDSSRQAEGPDSDSPLDPDQTLLGLGQAMLERMREAQTLLERTESFLARFGLTGAVEVRLEDRGVVMELPDQILFDRASAELKPEAREFLTELARFLEQIEQRVIIEGHTCDLPISTAIYPSNWELSVMRAVRVTRYLVETCGLEPDRFIATGYGEYRPLRSNDTAEGRARNRRITVVLSLSK